MVAQLPRPTGYLTFGTLAGFAKSAKRAGSQVTGGWRLMIYSFHIERDICQYLKGKNKNETNNSKYINRLTLPLFYRG